MGVIVTGGAGFIGSCVVRMLNDRGIDDIYVVDNIGNTEKWKHIVDKKYTEYIHKNDLFEKLDYLKGITHVIHMGACSSTTETNFDYLYANNYEYSKKLWNYCKEKKISFIYASSAATYGSGENGFDDCCDISRLRPLNGYGYSKQLFDLWVEKQTEKPKQRVGFKFFNVYGPNEDCKGNMASVVFKSFNEIKTGKKVNLFKSYNPKYCDGGQLRDFVYVKDICKIISFVMDNEDVNGLFNLGTGVARSFDDLARATFKAMNLEPNIEYIEMPLNLKEKYQYYTEAKIQKLRDIGYNHPFYSLEEGITDYVKNYLMGNRVY